MTAFETSARENVQSDITNRGVSMHLRLETPIPENDQSGHWSWSRAGGPAARRVKQSRSDCRGGRPDAGFERAIERVAIRAWNFVPLQSLQLTANPSRVALAGIVPH